MRIARTTSCLILCLLTCLCIMASPQAQAVTSVGANGLSFASAVCGSRDGFIQGKVPVTPAEKVVTRNGVVDAMAVSGQTVYVLDNSARQLSLYNMDGTPLATLPVSPGPFTVAPDGSFYTVENNYTLVKRSVDGTVAFRVTMPSPISSLGGLSSGGWTLIVVMRDRTSLVDASTGEIKNNAAGVEGAAMAPTPSGGVITTDSHFVRTYDAALQPVTTIGSAAGANDAMPDGAPLHFHILGQALQLPDGRFIVADSGRGLWLLDSNGFVLGLAAESGIGPITQAGALALIGSQLLFSTGSPYTSNQHVSAVALSDVLSMALSTASPMSNRLGFGAGLVADSPLNYFEPGSPVVIKTSFTASYRSLAGLTLTYSTRSAAQVSEGVQAPMKSLDLTPTALATGAALDLPSPVPGAYQVDAHLLLGGREVASTCVPYSVGASGDALHVTGLPGRADAGGPDGPRGVALADVLGTGAHRMALDWRKLLDANGNTDFSKYDPEVQAASAEAARRHVLLSLQLGSGGPERAFVDNGTWGARVQQVIAHYAPYVDYWEAWNEPNITYGSATDYVNKILKPFSNAVLAADPTAKRIGGTVVGIDNLPYWQQMISAGALSYMDIAAIHPYPGHNRSFEEEGFTTRIQQLKDMISAAGSPGMPVWITEFAFWSNGPGNWFSQADKSVRAKILSKSLGIDNWEYFIAQGTWGNNDVSFSAIEGDSLVKPVAVALMQAKNELAGRRFLGWVATGIPHAYAARYGAAPGSDESTLLAVWSDDAALPAVISGTQGDNIMITSEYGAAAPLTLQAAPTPLLLKGSVQYLTEPVGRPLSLAPAEGFGPDLALASGGAVASATSSNRWNPPGKAIDGIASALGQGDYRSSPAWASAPGDATPSLTVTFGRTITVDRVIYSTAGLGSVLPGVRDADVDVQTTGGSWVRVGSVRNAFALRTSLISFDPVDAQAVRLTVTSVNLGGYNGGAAPSFWPSDAASLQDETQAAYGPAIIRELEVYAPGAVAATGSAGATAASPVTAPNSSPSPAPTAAASAGATTAPESSGGSPSAPSGPSPAPVPAQSSTSEAAPIPSPAPSPAPSAAPNGSGQTASSASSTVLTGPASLRSQSGRTITRVAFLRTSNAQPVAGQMVSMLTKAHRSSVWRTTATRTTGSNGAAAFSLTPRVTTDVLFTYAGSPNLKPARSGVSSVLTTFGISLRSTATSVRPGATVTLTGHLTPSAAGSVVLQRLVGGQWRNVARLSLSASSCRYAYRVPTAGTYSLRLYRSADANTATSTSSTLTIKAAAPSSGGFGGDGGGLAS